jgi:hypothetical protein
MGESFASILALVLTKGKIDDFIGGLVDVGEFIWDNF